MKSLWLKWQNWNPFLLLCLSALSPILTLTTNQCKQLINYGSNMVKHFDPKHCNGIQPWLVKVKWSQNEQQLGLNPAILAYMHHIAFHIPGHTTVAIRGCSNDMQFTVQIDYGIWNRATSFKHHDSSVLHLCWICLVVHIPTHFNIWYICLHLPLDYPEVGK